MNIVIKHITLSMIAALLALVYLLTLPSGGPKPIISPVGTPVAQEPPSFEHWEQADER